MKESRHQKILEIIEQGDVYTQEGILKKLNEAGFIVTQATVSRDIKKLNLIKVMTPNGKYRYVNQDSQVQIEDPKKFQSVFIDSVIDVDYAMNIAVVKCHVGFADAACAALDFMNLSGVVGTLAGDDTIFVLLRTEKMAEDLVEEIRQLIGK